VSLRGDSPPARLTPEGLRDALRGLPGAQSYWVGFSGGVDSTVLLHLLAALGDRLEAPLRAVHVNHGLDPRAAEWERHCAAFCRQAGIELVRLAVDARPARGDSPEAAARQARYDALAALLRPDDMLLTAHHRDDQAETLLLQLLRGAGVEGLAGMAAWRRFGPGWLARPLLAVTRAQVHAYARREHLSWIEDPSNARLHADRNFLRHQVMPVLRARWPGAVASMVRSAGHCAAAAEVLHGQAEAWLDGRCPTAPAPLPLSDLRELPAVECDRVLRAWLGRQGVPMPPARRLAELRRQALAARADAAVVIVIGDAAVRRFRDALWVTPALLPTAPESPVDWPGEASELALGGGAGRLCRSTRAGGIAPAKWRSGRVSVVFRHAGLRFRLPGRHGSRSFKQLAQAYGIPPWERALTPIVTIDGEPAALGRYCVCAGFAADPGESGWIVEWQANGGRGDGAA
jgi:tRNA(Ile)-lysidine synthase